MQQANSVILTSVAYPPTILFVPPKAFLGNLVANLALYMFTGGVLTSIPPYIWFGTFALAHFWLMWQTGKDPHWMSLAESQRQRLKSSNTDDAAGGQPSPFRMLFNAFAPKSVSGKKSFSRLSAKTRNIVRAEGKKYVP